MSKKARTREQIVEVARELFLAEGLIAVGMERIAERAETTRRNLYRHFPTKESLAYEVITQLFDGWNREQREIYARLEGSGGRRLADFLEALVETLDRQRPMLRFFGEFDVVFQDSQQYEPSPEAARVLGGKLDLSEALIRELLELGMGDGSLRRDLDLPTLVPTLTTSLWSLAQRVALRDRMLKAEFGVEGLAMIRAHIALVSRALKEDSHEA